MVLSISGIESLLVEPLATLHSGSAGKWALLPCFQQTAMESGSKGRIWLTTSKCSNAYDLRVPVNRAVLLAESG